jgi:hypothetical protein
LEAAAMLHKNPLLFPFYRGFGTILYFYKYNL